MKDPKPSKPPQQSRLIRVLIVDDSPTAAQLLNYVLSADPLLQVVGQAADGEEAVEEAQRLKPDVITMDIHMPRSDGFEATRRIMETCPTPIVMVSGSVNVSEVATNFRAVEAGALAVMSRPSGLFESDHERLAQELVRAVKTLSEVKVIRRWPRNSLPVAATPPARVPRSAAIVKMVIVGASTGGPVALQALLAGLPLDFPVPVLIVQHMSSGFTQGFAQWLGQASRFPVAVAMDGELLVRGRAYVAPDEHHMGIRNLAGQLYVSLVSCERQQALCPSVAHLFRSARETCGAAVIAVLLTGMGRDGVEELKALKDLGATTIAQNEETSVIHGMPGEAIRAGAATHVLSPEEAAKYLAAMVAQS